MTADRDTPIVVTVIQKPNGRYRTRITRNGTAYGRDRAFDTQAAALIHCAQMLRVLADDMMREPAS